jgi:hypothetical protein
VHEQLSTEHRQWLAAAESIQPAVEALDATLAGLKLKPPDQATTKTAGQP